MTDPRIKTLKIKTGIVKRLTKEKATYIKEVQIEEARLEKFKAEGKDEHVLKKQQEVLQETVAMVPNCQRRLAAAFEDLNNIILSEKDLSETEEFKAALAALEEAKTQMSG